MGAAQGSTPSPSPVPAVPKPITGLFSILTERPNRPIWTDRWAIALALLGLLVDGAFALFLWQRFDTLPELIALHYNAFGEADLIGSKSEIYKLPLIGAVIWASNTALAIVSSPLDRVLARAALGVALFVQVLLCLGAWRILT